MEERTEQAAAGAASLFASVKGYLAVIAGTIGAIKMEFPLSLAVLCGFMTADYLTGVGAAWINKTANRDRAGEGLIRKFMVLIGAISAFFVSMVIPDVKAFGLDLGKVDIGSFVCCSFAVKEFLSIFHNIGKSGKDLPPVVRKLLARLEHFDDEGKPVEPTPSNENPAAGGIFNP